MTDLPLAKKSLGQHWLTDDATLNAICDAGDVQGTDMVLEIGPGTGTLTKKLLQRAEQVVAVEFDEQLAAMLPQRLQANNLQVRTHDILRFDFSELPTDYKVVANIPYYLTSNLIRVLSETPSRAVKVVLLVQKEVAVRVAAPAGDMSLLSVSAQFYWEVTLGIEVPAALFSPPPKVDSKVLILNRRSKLFEVDEKLFFRIVKAGFSARRKTLLNSLAGGLRTDKNLTTQILESAKIVPNLRAQNLSLDDWQRLYQACKTFKIN